MDLTIAGHPTAGPPVRHAGAGRAMTAARDPALFPVRVDVASGRDTDAGRGLRHRSMRQRPGFAAPVARLLSAALVLVVLAVSVPQTSEARVSEPYASTITMKLSPGIKYLEGSMRTGKRKLIQSVRVAKVKPYHPYVRLRSLMSNDLVVGLELPSRLAQRVSVPGMAAVVATNGDMARARRVDGHAAPHSLAVSVGELLVAQACTRPTLGIDSAGGVRIDDVRTYITMSPPGRLGPKQIHRVNTPREDTKLVLYTSRFATSTQTMPGGVEVILSLPDLLRPNGVQWLQVLEVRPGAGDTPLQPGMAVLSAGDLKYRWVHELQPGQQIRLETTVVRNVDSRCGGTIEAAPGWGDTKEAMGGNYYTLRDGVIAAPTVDTYPASVQRHPRTNVGITADGRVLMVTVDGRQPGHSIGVTLAEMGELMGSLGAVNAINLDGGGSTVMATRSLKTGRLRVVSRPSDGHQRLAPQALAAFQHTPGL